MKLYYNGTVITMASAQTAEALLTDGGVIRAAGPAKALRDMARGAETEEIDLEGGALLPAFVDSHGHIMQYAMSLGSAELGACKSMGQLRQTIEDYCISAPEAQWLTGFGYDPENLKEKTHPTKEMLDELSPGRPIVVTHASGHMGVVNSRALELAGITRSTPDPEGGKIGRDQAGEPNGYLEENAFFRLSAIIPRPDESQILGWMQKAQQVYLSYGVATAQEGLMGKGEHALLTRAAERGLLEMDIVGYADIIKTPELMPPPSSAREYRGGFRVGGYKLFLDGSPQGRTAWLRQPYLGAEDGYRGYPVHTDAQVRQCVALAEEAHAQLLVHCNGDAAVEQLLGAYQSPTQLRTVIIHAQCMGRDQLPRAKALGLMPSFFVAHTRRWGDVHIRNLGMERAAFISPAGSAQALGMPFTFHQDTPVLPPDMLDTIQCAVLRVTQGGVALSGREAITVYQALQAVTAYGAYQYFEENRKGTLEPGKQADLVQLSADPLAVPPQELNKLRVVRTVKAGRQVYYAPVS